MKNHQRRSMRAIPLLSCSLPFLPILLCSGQVPAADSAAPLRDKTLVVWAAPANLAQQGGSALTLDDQATHFDGVVFGELTAGKWMAGSDFYRRTCREQEQWAVESSTNFVQIAIAYRGQEVSILRNGVLYARYTMANPAQTFSGRSPGPVWTTPPLEATDKETLLRRPDKGRAHLRPCFGPRRH